MVQFGDPERVLEAKIKASVARALSGDAEAIKELVSLLSPKTDRTTWKQDHTESDSAALIIAEQYPEALQLAIPTKGYPTQIIAHVIAYNADIEGVKALLKSASEEVLLSQMLRTKPIPKNPGSDVYTREPTVIEYIVQNPRSGVESVMQIIEQRPEILSREISWRTYTWANALWNHETELVGSSIAGTLIYKLQENERRAQGVAKYGESELAPFIKVSEELEEALRSLAGINIDYVRISVNERMDELIQGQSSQYYNVEETEQDKIVSGVNLAVLQRISGMLDALPQTSLRDSGMAAEGKTLEGHVSIKGLDKAEVLAALFNAAYPQGFQVFDQSLGDMPEEAARYLLENPDLIDRLNNGEAPGRKYFSYIQERSLYVDLTGDYLNPANYDRMYGKGAAERVIRELREGRGPYSGSIRAARKLGLMKVEDWLMGILRPPEGE